MSATGAPAALPLPSEPIASATPAPVVAAGLSGKCTFCDFAGFVQHLREPSLPPAVISPRRFSEALNVDLQTLAAWARVHRNTVQRTPGSEAVQAYLRHALRVIRAAIDPCGGIEATLFWFRNEPLPAFDFETPARVVSAEGPERLLLALRTNDQKPGSQQRTDLLSAEPDPGRQQDAHPNGSSTQCPHDRQTNRDLPALDRDL